MRGPKFASRLKREAFQPVETGTAIPKTIPAPIGGWNTRDPLAAMKPTDAVVLDNFYPRTGDVALRPGKISWATGAAGSIRTLATFTSGTASQMFAFTDSGVYNVSSSGAVGAAVATTTNGAWEFRNFRNSGGPWLLAVNGVDKYKTYNGTTWQALDGSTTPAITGVASTDLTNIHVFKNAVWFTLKNSLSAYYLATQAIAGAATEFPMGPAFTKGGYLVAQYSWTIDGGQGSDDYLITVTSEGQMAVHQGTNPATDFQLVGIYDVGKPLGKRCFLKYGGDVLYLSKRGVFVLSKLLLSATIDRSIALSDKIDEAFKQSVLAYSSQFGWQAMIHPLQNALVVNIPMAAGQLSVQYVMNILTKSWCRFVGWSMDCLGEYNDNLYCGIGSTVYQIWQGLSDAGTAIAGKAQQAYISLGQPSYISLFRPQIALQGGLTAQAAIDTDFTLFSGVSQDSILSYATNPSYWDSGLWDNATWSSGITPVSAQWEVTANNPGIFHSFRLQTTSSNAILNWTSTDFAVMRAGLL